MAVCYLGIGSNLGNRRENIRLAIGKLNALKGVKVVKMSGIIETKPAGGPKIQGKFLNAALKIKTDLSAISLLKQIKRIERELGRTKTLVNGPRIIDLDILLYENKVIKRKELIVPHPRMFERDFVMRPLSEII